MKLKLLALAVGGLMAGVVSAQSANVTLYGVLDLSLSNERSTSAGGKGGTSGTYVDSGGLSGSRWGLRGSESLGGGLNAVFVAESGFNADTGLSAQGGRLFGRQVFVGLNGGFGSFTMGRQYSPMFSVLCEVDIDGCSSYSVVGNHYLGVPGALRVDNTLVYATPNMGGITAAVMWGAGESTAGTNAGRTLGANLQYKGGPIYAGFGYSDVKNAAGTSSTRAWTAGGAFDAGVAKIAANYLESKGTAAGAPKFKGYQVGAAIPFGATTALLNVGQGKANLPGSPKNTLFMLGADHSLSKRTTAYARVGLSNNNAASGLDMFHGGTALGIVNTGTLGASGSSVAPAAAGSDERIIAFGIRHRF